MGKGMQICDFIAGRNNLIAGRNNLIAGRNKGDRAEIMHWTEFLWGCGPQPLPLRAAITKTETSGKLGTHCGPQ